MESFVQMELYVVSAVGQRDGAVNVYTWVGMHANQADAEDAATRQHVARNGESDRPLNLYTTHVTRDQVRVIAAVVLGDE